MHANVHANRQTCGHTFMFTCICRSFNGCLGSFIHFIGSFIHFDINSSIHQFIHSSLIHSYVHACMHAFIHSLIHACIRSFSHTYMHRYMRTLIHLCVIYIYISLYTYTYTYTHTHIYIYIYMHACMRVIVAGTRTFTGHGIGCDLVDIGLFPYQQPRWLVFPKIEEVRHSSTRPRHAEPPKP